MFEKIRYRFMSMEQLGKELDSISIKLDEAKEWKEQKPLIDKSTKMFKEIIRRSNDPRFLRYVQASVGSTIIEQILKRTEL